MARFRLKAKRKRETSLESLADTIRRLSSYSNRNVINRLTASEHHTTITANYNPTLTNNQGSYRVPIRENLRNPISSYTISTAEYGLVDTVNHRGDNDVIP